jgi:hypothetical protein
MAVCTMGLDRSDRGPKISINMNVLILWNEWEKKSDNQLHFLQKQSTKVKVDKITAKWSETKRVCVCNCIRGDYFKKKKKLL